MTGEGSCRPSRLASTSARPTSDSGRASTPRQPPLPSSSWTTKRLRTCCVAGSWTRRPPVGVGDRPGRPTVRILAPAAAARSSPSTLENPMIHVLAVITAKPGQRERILEAYRDNVAAVRAEAGCVAYEAVVDVANPAPGYAAYGADT